jgi:hypothetical protein
VKHSMMVIKANRSGNGRLWRGYIVLPWQNHRGFALLRSILKTGSDHSNGLRSLNSVATFAAID